MSLLVFTSLLFLIHAATYCPSANDLTVAYGSPSIVNQGWTISGGGGAATKSAFNLLGGSVEYDVDFSRTNPGVNANIYSISPLFSGSFTLNAYCDGQKSGSAWCTEIDWIESNGNCGGATTLHTLQGTGSVGCTAWGCSQSYSYSRPTFHMKISYALDGTITVVRDGVTISQSSLSPAVLTSDTQNIQQYYSQRGAVVYSSQWVGWVPTVGSCSSSGDLTSSSFTISNLVINGAVVQGPTPTLCGSTPNAPVSAPVAAPVKAPVAAPVSAPVSKPPPPSTGSSQCAIAGSNNNVYYYEVQSVAGASVSIKCSSGYVQSCSLCTWGDKTYYQCNVANGQQCNSPTPTCQIGSASACSIAGSNNNAWYYEVQSVASASVSVQCSSGYVQSCSVSTWGDPTYYQCNIANGQQCNSPNPTCHLSGSRLEDSPSSSLPAGAIAGIVVGACVLVALIAGAILFFRTKAGEERP